MNTKSTAFIINTQLELRGGRCANISPTCKQCNLGRLKLIGDNIKLKLICERCLYEIHYMRINRND